MDTRPGEPSVLDAPPPASTPYAEVQVGADRVALLRDGAQAYPAMLAAIAAARSTVCLETYILRSDRTGLRFAEALCERSRAGVEVSVMYDDWGSEVSAELHAQLKDAGVRTVAFLPVRFRYGIERVLTFLRRRNHRKSLVVDGEVAFTGGLNISDDYASVEDGGHGWRDTHVRIEGPSALEFEQHFLALWKRHKGAPVDAARYFRAPVKENPQLKVLSNDFHRDRKDIRRAYLTAILRAHTCVSLTNAYFVPPARMQRALQRMARRNVEVRVILGAATDVRLVYYATRYIYGRLLKAGVRVFEWTERILHAKTAVVDGHWATVGSTNLDAMSLRENLEVNAVIEHGEFGAAMQRMFEEDLGRCREVTLDQWKRRGLFERLASWFAYQFRNWM